MKILSKFIPVPITIARLLLKRHKITLADVNLLPTDIFVSLDTVLEIIAKNIDIQQQKLEDALKIVSTKNPRLVMRDYKVSHDKSYDYDVDVIQKSVPLNSDSGVHDFKGIIFNTDIGIVVEKVVSEWSPPNWDESVPKQVHEFLYLSIDRDKLVPFINSKNSPSKIEWDRVTNSFVVKPTPPLLFEFNTDEDETKNNTSIIINHQLGSRRIVVQVFAINAGEVDFRTPIDCLIEYPSDNQCRLYLSWKQPIHVMVIP